MKREGEKNGYREDGDYNVGDTNDNGLNDGSCSHDASCGYYVICISGNGRYIVD